MKHTNAESARPGKTFLVAVILAFSAVAQEADKPNFVVILTDDQSSVGSSLQMIPDDARTRSDCFRTPNLERLAKLGMRFTQGYAPAACVS